MVVGLVTIPIGAFLGLTAFIGWTLAILYPFTYLLQNCFGYDTQNLGVLSFMAVGGAVAAVGIGAVCGPILCVIAYRLSTPSPAEDPTSNQDASADNPDALLPGRIESITLQATGVILASLPIGLLAGQVLCALTTLLVVGTVRLAAEFPEIRVLADTLQMLVLVAAVNLVPYLSLGLGVLVAWLLKLWVFGPRTRITAATEGNETA